MTIEIDIVKVRRESMRWIILLALYNSRPIRAADELIITVIRGVYPNATQQEVRRELGYVEGRGLAEITRHPDGKWFTCLTAKGVDVVEYNAVCESGIARPEKYWSS